jgi:hypothetical protein
MVRLAMAWFRCQGNRDTRRVVDTDTRGVPNTRVFVPHSDHFHNGHLHHHKKLKKLDVEASTLLNDGDEPFLRTKRAG